MTVTTPSHAYHFDHDIGDVVYHKLGTARRRGMVTGYWIDPNSGGYWITWPDHTERKHYAIELSTEWEPDFTCTED